MPNKLDRDTARDFRIILGLFAAVIVSGVWGLFNGDKGAPIMIGVAVIMMGVAWLAKRGWDRRPRP